jgi:accessory gene regulator protein AgrB
VNNTTTALAFYAGTMLAHMYQAHQYSSVSIILEKKKKKKKKGGLFGNIFLSFVLLFFFTWSEFRASI